MNVHIIMHADCVGKVFEVVVDLKCVLNFCTVTKLVTTDVRAVIGALGATTIRQT